MSSTESLLLGVTVASAADGTGAPPQVAQLNSTRGRAYDAASAVTG